MQEKPEIVEKKMLKPHVFNSWLAALVTITYAKKTPPSILCINP